MNSNQRSPPSHIFPTLEIKFIFPFFPSAFFRIPSRDPVIPPGYPDERKVAGEDIEGGGQEF
jgi:hypothetical protein